MVPPDLSIKKNSGGQQEERPAVVHHLHQEHYCQAPKKPPNPQNQPLGLTLSTPSLVGHGTSLGFGLGELDLGLGLDIIFQLLPNNREQEQTSRKFVF